MSGEIYLLFCLEPPLCMSLLIHLSVCVEASFCLTHQAQNCNVCSAICFRNSCVSKDANLAIISKIQESAL